jgi:hypothetical protein
VAKVLGFSSARIRRCFVMCVFRNDLEMVVDVIKKLRYLHGLPVSLNYKLVVLLRYSVLF